MPTTPATPQGAYHAALLALSAAHPTYGYRRCLAALRLAGYAPSARWVRDTLRTIRAIRAA